MKYSKGLLGKGVTIGNRSFGAYCTYLRCGVKTFSIVNTVDVLMNHALRIPILSVPPQ